MINLNGQCVLDSVFINSLLIDPSGSDFSYDTNGDEMVNSNDEFVEICNSSLDTVDISGWRIGDDDPPPFPDYQIPDSTFLAPGACIVLVANYCPDMPVTCNTPSGVLNMNYQFSGFLGNAGDVISLVDTLGNSCSVVYGSTICSQVDLLEIPDFDINACDDWGGDIDGCPLLALGDSCDYEPVVLPIEFLEFDISVINDQVNINWLVVESSPNSKYFVQWTSNLNLPFENIGFENNNGDFGEPNSYNYIHSGPVNGLNYYRVVQQELTGLTSVSKTGVADLSRKLHGQVLPNLVSDAFCIKGNSDIYDILIFDMSGRSIIQIKNVLDQHQIDISNLESGYYIINVSSSNGYFNQPIVKL